ncbi:MAG: helix-turn-helix domain-containing protein, partial [Pricia sp.]
YGQTWEYKFMDVFGKFIEAAYIIAEVYYLLRYRKLLLENYTGKAYFQNYYWLRQLIFFILIGQVLTLIKGYIRDSSAPEFTDDYRILLLAYGLFFSIWLVWKAMHSPKLFRGIAVDLKLSKELMQEDDRHAAPSKETQDQITELKNYMSKEKPFLNAGLTVQKLANETGLPSKELSVLINQHLNQHFFDFVNGYRIENAMRILCDPAKKDLTVLEILYEVGFNSKSSFNTAFRKHTGTTPTAYRKKH